MAKWCRGTGQWRDADADTDAAENADAAYGKLQLETKSEMVIQLPENSIMAPSGRRSPKRSSSQAVQAVPMRPD